MSISIELIFFYVTKRIDRFQLSFQTEPKEINKAREKIILPDSIFKYGKDKSQMSIKLFKTNSDENNEYNFYVYYGENKAYIELENFSLKTYEIILRNIKNLKIYGVNHEFTEFDTIENKDKKRLVLINYVSNYLYINKVTYDLGDIILRNCEIQSSSYQISEIDLKTLRFIVKPFEPKDECNIGFLQTNKDKYQSFANDLDELFYFNNEKYITSVNDIKSKYINLSKYDFINFHKTNEYLSELFKSNKFLDLDLFFNFFKCIYFFDYLNDFINKRTVTQCFIQKIEEIFEDIKNKNNLPIYEKIRALNALVFTNDNLKNINELNSLNIKYYIISEKNENSILYKVAKFLDKCITDLNENSAILENFFFRRRTWIL